MTPPSHLLKYVCISFNKPIFHQCCHAIGLVRGRAFGPQIHSNTHLTASSIAFSSLTLFVGWQEGHRPVKTEWLGAGVVICLGQGVDVHMAQLMTLPLTISCFSKIHIGFTFLAPAHPGNPGQDPESRKTVVCVCVTASFLR